MPRQLSQAKKPDIEKEFRFAVVMYGGVSLAIYINGVAQELYRMVRATARTKNKKNGSLGDYVIRDAKGTEVVYRELGERLKARFIVDILSGTSAGGINAIYLAKALAFKLPFDRIETLWVEKGDIDVLINDKKSIVDQLKLTRPPRSLLNSDRIYWELLHALDGMDEVPERVPNPESVFVDELDLYVTTTDLRGWPLPIALADGVTDENRYRTVFRFHHSTLGKPDEWLQDFRRDNNPFLAFAARATSAFPFAFRPANLRDARELAALLPYYRNITGETHSWSNFYSEYISKNDRFDLRSFGDGGALDNKPFSYITETLLRRQSDIPVDRRLFYIEPAPEHPKEDAPLNEPNFVENVLAQAVDLPRRETIREDLLQIKARNDLIQRTNNILRQVGTTAKTISTIWKSGDANKVDWQNRYLDEILPIYGVGYAAYHQLRVLDTLDNFAVALGRNLGIDESDDTFPTLRQIVEEWRKRKYSPNSVNNQTKVTENDLLYRMDLGWHIRRIHFVLGIIDDLLLGLDDFRPGPENADAARQTTPAQELVMNSNLKHEKWIIDDDAIEAKFSEALSKVKHEINEAYTELKLRGRKLRRRGLALEPVHKDMPKNLRNYASAIRVLQRNSTSLEQILKDPSQLEMACDEIETVSLTLGARARTEKRSSMGYLHEIISRASHRCKTALDVDDEKDILLAKTPVEARDPASNVRMCLKYYYQHFEYFDMLTFPIAYATPIGESDQMDVYRISPDDAKGLFIDNEKKHKLAGIKFGNFGAFLRKEWRQNDILWGQLDAAERIIVTVLPNVDDHKELLVRAWLTILDEKREYLGVKNLQKLDECLGHDWERFVHPQAYTSTIADELKEKLNHYFSDYKPELKSGLFSRLSLLARGTIILANLLMNLLTRYFISPMRPLILIALAAEAFVMLAFAATPFFVGRISRLNWIVLILDAVALLVSLSLLGLIHYYKTDAPAASDRDEEMSSTKGTTAPAETEPMQA